MSTTLISRDLLEFQLFDWLQIDRNAAVDRETALAIIDMAERLASAPAPIRPKPNTCLDAANEPSVHPAQPSYRGGDQGRQQWRLYTLSPTPSDLTTPVHGTGGIH